MNRTKVLLPVILLALGAVMVWGLLKTSPQVEPAPEERVRPLVRTLAVRFQDVPLILRTQGTVQARTETTLIAQVAGEVVRLSPNLEAGAFFDRGEVLLTLDARDHELALERAEAQVAQARLDLVWQEAEAEVARDEWASLGEEPTPLALREPQVARAKATLAAAEADLARARLDLERTRIRAPFSGRTRARQVDLGQFLNRGTPIAEIQSTDVAEVRLPVPDDQLAFVDLPHVFREGAPAVQGPRVDLHTDFAGQRHTWQGQIVRSEGEVAQDTRMLHLVARVERPYHRSAEAPERPPLATGLFVQAEIHGRTAREVVLLPRSALHRSNQVLVVDASQKLRIRPVEILRLDGEEVLISSGLEPGEQVSISSLDLVVDGMDVRTVDSEEPPEDAP